MQFLAHTIPSYWMNEDKKHIAVLPHQIHNYEIFRCNPDSTAGFVFSMKNKSVSEGWVSGELRMFMHVLRNWLFGVAKKGTGNTWKW